MSKGLKTFLTYSIAALLLFASHYAFLSSSYPASAERETSLTEIGEAVGEFALWLCVFIYARMVLKFVIGTRPLARRLLPSYTASESTDYFRHVLVYLDRSHVYFSVASLTLARIHFSLMGLHAEILFSRSCWRWCYSRDCLAYFYRGEAHRVI
ncbi:MAG: hypothetical protein ACI9DC_004135 [Gammaproteobacteria bacterium]|jgi:hypothetical protein